MGLRRIESPTDVCFTGMLLDEYLVISEPDDLPIVDSLRKAAFDYIERMTSRQLYGIADWTLTLDRFPAAEIELRVCPVRSMKEVTYIDPAGVEQTLAPENYQLDASSEPGRLFPSYGNRWPATRQQPNAVSAKFEAGYPRADEEDEDSAVLVPPAALQAVALLTAHWFENRAFVGTVTPDIATAIEGLLWSLRWSTY